MFSVLKIPISYFEDFLVVTVGGQIWQVISTITHNDLLPAQDIHSLQQLVKIILEDFVYYVAHST